MKPLIPFITFLLLLFTISCGDDDPASDEEIVFGGISALTGGASIYGLADRQVSDLIFDEINAAGGINGRNIRVIWMDTECNPSLAAAAAEKLIEEEGVHIILGDACSGSTLAAAEITEEEDVILFTAVATSAGIKDAGDFVFRTTASDATAGKVLGEHASQNYSKVGMLTEQTAYAEDISDRFEEIFTGEVLRLSFPDPEADFESLIQQIMDENVEALVVMPQAPPTIRTIADALIDLNWQAPLLGNEMLALDEDIVSDYTPQLSAWNAVAARFLAPPSPELESLKSRYQARFGEKLDQVHYAANVADRNEILRQILEQLDDVNDTRAIRDALYSISNYEGLSGTFSFDEFGEVDLSHSLLAFDGEKFVVN